MTAYRERLWPSPALLIALLLVIPATLLVFVPINSLVGVIVGVGLYAGAVVFLAVSSQRTTVTEDGLQVGVAHLPATAIGDVSHFAGEDATAERGVRLDARAWLAIRGGVSPVVRVGVNDADDPTPYWLISTRKPVELSSALEAIRQRTPGR